MDLALLLTQVIMIFFFAVTGAMKVFAHPHMVLEFNRFNYPYALARFAGITEFVSVGLLILGFYYPFFLILGSAILVCTMIGAAYVNFVKRPPSFGYGTLVLAAFCAFPLIAKQEIIFELLALAQTFNTDSILNDLQTLAFQQNEQTIKATLSPYYLYIKFIHLFFVMIWSWSTAVAYTWYVKGAFLKWAENPNDQMAIQRRNWAIEQFDKGVILEHVAFPVVITTGPLLYFLSGWDLFSGWLFLKVLVVVFIFVPIEIADYYLSHFGGNKEKLRKRGEMEKYERAIQQHWLFLKVSTPLIIIFMPLAIFLAVVKPYF